MSSTDPKDAASGELTNSRYKELRSLPNHNKKPDCPLCKHNKEAFGSTVKTCYESDSPNAGEDTKTFIEGSKQTY
jgi:hypothetical protein